VTESRSTAHLRTGEFVPLMALLVSLTAMAIDAMLPALGLIAKDLHLDDANDAQLVVTALFVGMSVGQLIMGPLSDSVGRKRAIFTGLLLFVAGAALSFQAETFEAMLVGRAMQGLGAAGPRIVCMAIVRDLYKGRDMARILSIIMAVFIIVPAIAPALGQAILTVAPWRTIYAFLLLQGVVAALWFVRQPETLEPARRLPLRPGRIWLAVVETVQTRSSLGYTLAAGTIFGAFLGYLSSAQQIFVDTYGVGDDFPLYFGALSLSLGAAALLNSRLVMRLGMRAVCWRALTSVAVLGVGFAAVVWTQDGLPGLPWFMAYLLATFLCVGLLFGNFNSLALEPLGHIAGTAAAVIGSLSTVISLVLGYAIGSAYDGTVLPLVSGFAALGLVALFIVAWTERTA